jgi:hypothetical protein
MKMMVIPAAVGMAILVSCGVAVARDHKQGAPGGGAVHAQRGAAVARSRGPHAESRAPRVHRAEHAQRSHRSERVRRAEPRRLEHARRVQHAQRPSKDVRRAGREGLSAKQKSAEERGGKLEQRVTERHNEIQTARMQLSADKKEQLHRAFNFDRARIAKVNFDPHVGRRIPRHVRLFPIPVAVFAFFPYYRDYSYFVVDDEICIVDSDSYVVVDVIEPGYWGSGRPQVAELRLTEREIALVRDSIAADFPDAGLRLRLALGAEIPADVELHQFAPLVLDRVRKLREYQFLVSGDQIVIVQPRDHSIALVIDRRS